MLDKEPRPLIDLLVPTLERCQVNNRFEPCGLAVDTITQEVIEGQSPQKLHINTYCGQFLLFREG